MRRVIATASSAAIAAALLLGAWLMLAPASLGGATRYAIVEGASMEPELSRGDLVLVRARQRPEVGDVVLYRDPALGVRVLHRVVRIENGRVVLKGDANDFVDDAHPRPDDVVGTYWFAIPRIGDALVWLRSPLHASVLAFLLAIVALSGGIIAQPAGKEELSGG
jgi:signal peptidase I